MDLLAVDSGLPEKIDSLIQAQVHKINQLGKTIGFTLQIENIIPFLVFDQDGTCVISEEGITKIYEMYFSQLIIFQEKQRGDIARLEAELRNKQIEITELTKRSNKDVRRGIQSELESARKKEDASEVARLDKLQQETHELFNKRGLAEIHVGTLSGRLQSMKNSWLAFIQSRQQRNTQFLQDLKGFKVNPAAEKTTTKPEIPTRKVTHRTRTKTHTIIMCAIAIGGPLVLWQLYKKEEPKKSAYHSMTTAPDIDWRPRATAEVQKAKPTVNLIINKSLDELSKTGDIKVFFATIQKYILEYGTIENGIIPGSSEIIEKKEADQIATYELSFGTGITTIYGQIDSSMLYRALDTWITKEIIASDLKLLISLFLGGQRTSSFGPSTPTFGGNGSSQYGIQRGFNGMPSNGINKYGINQPRDADIISANSIIYSTLSPIMTNKGYTLDMMGTGIISMENGELGIRVTYSIPGGLLQETLIIPLSKIPD